jgi:hypothetical protein
VGPVKSATLEKEKVKEKRIRGADGPFIIHHKLKGTKSLAVIVLLINSLYVWLA